MTDGHGQADGTHARRAPGWAAFFAWAWVALLLAAALAELLDLERLRLALDLTRPLR